MLTLGKPRTTTYGLRPSDFKRRVQSLNTFDWFFKIIFVLFSVCVFFPVSEILILSLEDISYIV